MRWITLLVAALVAASAYGQENEAEKLYRAMEKKIRSAKTVHFAFDGQIIGKAKATVKGEAWLAEGEKGKLTAEADIAYVGDTNVKMMFISDGKSQYTKIDEQVNVKATKPEEKNLEKASGVIARVGMMMAFTAGFDALIRGSSPSKEPFDLDKMAAIRDFKPGAKETIGKHNTQAVDYQVSLGRATAKATVWIDTETKLPVKREFVLQEGGTEQGRISETYSTFTVNGEIDPKVFEVPK